MIKDSQAKGAMIGNLNMFLELNSAFYFETNLGACSESYTFEM
jgi:hypothetical protein